MECPHCHAEIPADSSTCPECGTAIRPGAGKDEGIYPELAKANLLRMRGDAKGAEAHLLSLLKKFPNNATAHEMLGDIFAEAGEDAQAAQWYELALDLAPDAPGLPEKLADAHARIAVTDQTNTAEHIGLDAPPSPRWWLFALGGVGLAVVILGGLALMWKYNTPQVIRSTIAAPPEMHFDSPAPSPTESPTNESPSPTSAATISPNVYEDQHAFANLSATAPDGARLIALASDPRAQSMQLTFTVRPGEDPRPFAARLAKAALDAYAACLDVTVRGSEEGRLVYVADVPRTKLAETESSSWQQTNPDAWIQFVLTNEWSAPGAVPSPSESPSAATGSSSPNPP